MGIGEYCFDRCIDLVGKAIELKRDCKYGRRQGIVKPGHDTLEVISRTGRAKKCGMPYYDALALESLQRTAPLVRVRDDQFTVHSYILREEDGCYDWRIGSWVHTKEPQPKQPQAFLEYIAHD